MNWKSLPVVLLAGAILAVSSTETSAHGLRSGGGFGGDCGCPCAPPCAAPAPVMQKVLVTEYRPEQYEAKRTVLRSFTKEEKFTAYKCEVVPVAKKQMVTYYTSVPKTQEVPVVRWECVPTTEERTVSRWECVPTTEERVVSRFENVPFTQEVPVVRWECVPTTEERVVSRWECVPTTEERTVTRMVATTVPVTTMVSRCVPTGGHYECREVPCGGYGGGCGGRHGLFRRHGGDCGCECPCGPAMMTVSVYVPTYATEQVPVTTYRTVCTPVTEKVMVTVNRMVEKKETVKVTVNRMVEKKETAKVTRYQCVEKKETIKVTVPRMVEKKETVKVTVNRMVEKKETVKVTTYETVPQTKEETYTVYETKTTPYEAKRMVCYTAPVEEKYMATRLVPTTVEREVPVMSGYCGGCDNYGGYGDCYGHHRGGLFHRGR